MSPQYHVVFDDTFATVFSDSAFTDNAWNSLLVSNIEHHPDAKEAIDTVPFVETITDATVQPQLMDDTVTFDFHTPTHTSTTTLKGETPESPSPEGAISAPEGVISTASMLSPGGSQRVISPGGGSLLSPRKPPLAPTLQGSKRLHSPTPPRHTT